MFTYWTVFVKRATPLPKNYKRYKNSVLIFAFNIEKPIRIALPSQKIHFFVQCYFNSEFSFYPNGEIYSM